MSAGPDSPKRDADGWEDGAPSSCGLLTVKFVSGAHTTSNLFAYYDGACWFAASFSENFALQCYRNKKAMKICDIKNLRWRVK